MNCSEARSRLLADPRQRGEERAHIDSCGACSALAREMAALDEAILAAANAVRLPEALPDRIMLKRGRSWLRWVVRPARATAIPK